MKGLEFLLIFSSNWLFSSFIKSRLLLLLLFIGLTDGLKKLTAFYPTSREG